MQDLKRLVCELDWRQTLLGARETWPQTLKTAADLVLACQFPMMLLWGPQLVQIYNNACRDLTGNKHPAGLGQPTRDCWPEAWQVNEPIYRRVWNGESVTLTGQLLPITRHGYPEQAYFTVYCSPVRDDVSQVAGVLVTFFETTTQRTPEWEMRESAERFRALVTTSSYVFYRMSSDWSEMQQLDGRGVLSSTERPNRDWPEEYVHPDDQPKVLAAIQHSYPQQDNLRAGAPGAPSRWKSRLDTVASHAGAGRKRHG